MPGIASAAPPPGTPDTVGTELKAAQNTKSSGSPESAGKPDQSKPAKAATVRFDIDEYRVEGADLMPQIDVEEAVYPFLGPGRTADDVEKARAELEKAYASKGYQTVIVSIPQQNVQSGVVVLKVTEVKVGRLRVKNSRYFDLDNIKNKAPSVAEGKVPNFKAVTNDIVALNQLPDRKVTPSLRAGAKPGTVDVDLNVEDKLPLHGSLEYNNRQSPNTTPTRINAAVRYDNLWQRGDSINFSYQVAPQRPDDVEVFSGSYLARTNIDWLNILVYALNSNSNVATVGGLNVVGPGQIFGTRAVMTLPSRDKFFHTVSAGIDYKNFGQRISLSETDAFSTPVKYFPVSVNYSASWQHEGATTQFNGGLVYGLRGLGSDPFEFDAKRYGAAENFLYVRGDATHTRELGNGFQLYGKLQGQVADQPLVSSEEYSVGGLDTVRGYLESETIGDNAVVGTIELRTPNIGEWIASASKGESGKPQGPTVVNDLRFFAFGDAGRAQTLRPLPGQESVFELASYGVGTRVKLYEYINGMVVFAIPTITQAFTFANEKRVVFRVWGEF
jgi:hemolysin activation/secretion protein